MGETALHKAAAEGRVEICAYLLSAADSSSAQDGCGGDLRDPLKPSRRVLSMLAGKQTLSPGRKEHTPPRCDSKYPTKEGENPDLPINSRTLFPRILLGKGSAQAQTLNPKPLTLNPLPENPPREGEHTGVKYWTMMLDRRLQGALACEE